MHDAARHVGLPVAITQATSATLAASQAAAFLIERGLPVYRRAGHQVHAVLTDGGWVWRGAFDVACRATGIAHRRAQPRHAWANGFVERLQGTILTECWRVVVRRTYLGTWTL